MDIEPKNSEVKVHCSFAGTSLRPWDSGSNVTELQVLLNACGYRLRIDGDFGQATESAVKAFQRHHQLKINGVVDAETWTALELHIQPGARLLRRGHTGTDVDGLQELLHAHGHAIERNGIFDETTEQTVISFQQQRQLNENGIVDAATWRCLRECSLSDKSSLPVWESISLGKWW